MALGHVILTAVGAAMVLAALYDGFRTLFVPDGRGLLSQFIASGVWRAVKAGAARLGTGGRRRVLSFAGPLAFVVVLGIWLSLLTLGWALVYLPHLPDRFSIAPGLAAAEQSSLLDALYFSMSALSSTGFGDISARADSMRVLVILEGIAGTVILGVGLSWLLSLYPAIGRKRSLAEKLSLMGRADLLPDRAGSSVAENLILDLTNRVAETRKDLAKFPIVYIFAETKEYASLAAQLHLLERTVASARGSDEPGVVQSGRLLDLAVSDLAETVSERFVPGDREGALRRWKQDHLEGGRDGASGAPAPPGAPAG